MARVEFEALLEQDDSTRGTFVRVPVDVRDLFGRARPPVLVTINGHRYRSTVAVYGGVSMIGVSRANRDAAGIVAGQQIAVVLESDEEGRPRGI